MRHYNYVNRRATPPRGAGLRAEPEEEAPYAVVEVEQWD